MSFFNPTKLVVTSAVLIGLASMNVASHSEAMSATTPVIEDVAAQSLDGIAVEALLAQLNREAPGERHQAAIEGHVIRHAGNESAYSGHASVRQAFGLWMPVEFSFRRGDDGVINAFTMTERPGQLAGPAANADTQQAVQDKIASEIIGEFGNQPVAFRIEQMSTPTVRGDQLVVSGIGTTDFFDEGLARTPFTAVLDRATGETLEIAYELLALEVPAEKLRIESAIASR